MSDSLQPHGLQHARLPCPSLFLGACSNSCPLSCWCHPTISFSVTSFSSCPQSFPASGSFPMSQLFSSGGQNIGTLASILPMNGHGLFLLGLSGFISCCPRDSQESSPAPQFKSIYFSALNFLYGSTLTSLHDNWENRIEYLLHSRQYSEYFTCINKFDSHDNSNR